MTPDFEKLFPAIGNCVKQTLADIPAPNGVVYACGFWLFYTDFTVIREPCFAYNVVGREGDAKWSPPEWAVDVEDHIVEALTPHYQKLTELMTGQRIEIWKSMIEFQWDYYSQLCLEITRDSPSLLHHWQVAEDFVCGIFEEREDEETYSRLLRSSIRDEVVEQLGILQDG